MRSIDKVLRAQARALIAVLDHYKLVRACGEERPPIWRDVEAFGTGSGTAVDLQCVGRNEAGTTAAAFCIGVKHRAPNAAVHLPRHVYQPVPEHRFLDPSRWIALALVLWTRGRLRDPVFQTKCSSSWNPRLTRRWTRRFQHDSQWLVFIGVGVPRHRRADRRFLKEPCIRTGWAVNRSSKGADLRRTPPRGSSTVRQDGLARVWG